MSGCDKVPLTAPPGTVITLVSTTNVLPINGETEIVAVLIEQGGTSTGTGNNASTSSAGVPVHNGTVVTFTTSLGRIDPGEAKTSNGRVTVKLTADGRSGRATVTAFSGSATKTLEVVIGAAAAERVAITAAPSLLSANGGPSTISARVEDASGNPLFGVPVAFTTSHGTLSTSTGLTNESGFATTTLTTTVETVVTASAGGKTSTVTVRIKPRSSLTIQGPTSAVNAGAAATFTITVGAGSDFADVSVQFGDGSSQSLGALSGNTTVNHYYEDPGTYTATVRGVDRDGILTTHPTSVAVSDYWPTLACSPASTTVGSPILCAVTSIPAGVSIDSYDWQFSGVTGHPESRNYFDASASQSHIFTQVGTKFVRVTINPSHGGSKTLETVVNMNPASGTGSM